MRTISFNIHPKVYGDGNVTEAFFNKDMGFELEIKTETSIYRAILDVDEATELNRKIADAIVSHQEFLRKQ